MDDHNEHQTSTWHEWNGYASSDRNPDGTLSVFLPELTPNATGAIDASTQTSDINLMNMPTTAGGTATPMKTTANLTTSITAYWIGQSNIKYPPFVRKGEQVRVMKYGDQDRYYWESMGRNPELRTVDTYRVEVANNASAGGTGLSDTNTHFLELSSEHNRVLLKTSKSNGEKFQFQILIDTAASTVTICDDQNNEILLDSTIPRIRFRNQQGCIFDMAKKSILIGAPEDIIIKADRQIVLQSPTITQNATGTLSLNAKGVAINGSGKVVTTSPKVGIGPVVVQNGNLTATSVQAPTVMQGAAAPPVTAPSTDISDGSSTS